MLVKKYVNIEIVKTGIQYSKEIGPKFSYKIMLGQKRKSVLVNRYIVSSKTSVISSYAPQANEKLRRLMPYADFDRLVL